MDWLLSRYHCTLLKDLVADKQYILLGNTLGMGLKDMACSINRQGKTTSHHSYNYTVISYKHISLKHMVAELQTSGEIRPPSCLYKCITWDIFFKKKANPETRLCLDTEPCIQRGVQINRTRRHEEE